MDGPKHYSIAQILATQADNALRAGEYDRASALAALAQVHATLARTAATAVAPVDNRDAWHNVAGPGSP